MARPFLRALCECGPRQQARRYTTFPRVTLSDKEGGPGPSSQAHRQRRSDKDEELEDAREALRRERLVERKRRQGGETFLDHVVVHVQAGKGGDGCAAFHREKFQEYGPPAGGNGGRGGDVFIMPTKHLTTLSSVPHRVKGEPGGNGGGAWLHGRAGAPTIIKVPLGTIVRKLPPSDPRCAPDPEEMEEERLMTLTPDERKQAIHNRRFVHFPAYEEENVKREDFDRVEKMLLQEEREIRTNRRRRSLEPLQLDLARAEEQGPDIDAPLALGNPRRHGALLASGGIGGIGNPAFVSSTTRSPKFATRGYQGERMSISLELKLLADVGLVGMPNAGKSTLLRALTGGRSRAAVAGYAFTTLNPSVAVVRVLEDGGFEGEGASGIIHDETAYEEETKEERMASGAYADALTFNQAKLHKLAEVSRFTVADNPGLIEGASNNVGLGHAFLRSIERSLALAYVVDLNGPRPWDELLVLRDELETYQAGLSRKARLVIANKADLLGGDGTDPQAVQEAQQKLSELQTFVQKEMAIPSNVPRGSARPLDVVPVSGKYSQNLRRVVRLMQKYVDEERIRERNRPL